ncbi:MAG: gluconate 2-dehydrogenase subunit 3 family protein [Saprospiraceae bacterium]|nr:gluconate 2-dehydrogenase subunit 3 family protein [Saprospiraceae bacterium]
MTRREAIESLGLVSTHVLFPSVLLGFVSGCQDPNKTIDDHAPAFFNPEEFEIIRQIVDIILPSTKSKSASEVFTHHFLDEVFSKCMDVEQQALIRDGMATLVPAFLSSDDQNSLLEEVDQKAYGNDEAYAYFRVIKQYTLVGFFTSQEGMTRASNFVKFPGDYKGEIISEKQTLSYGKTNLRYYL